MKKWMLLGALAAMASLAWADGPAKDASSSAADMAWNQIGDGFDALQKIDNSNEKALREQATKLLHETHDFYSKYPDDPHALNARVMWVQLGGQMGQNGWSEAPSDAEITQALDALAGDDRIPKPKRAELRAHQILNAIEKAQQAKGDTSQLWTAVQDRMDAFAKEFGADYALDADGPVLSQLRGEEVPGLTLAPETPVTRGILEKLKSDRDPQLAELAGMALKELDALAGITKKPFDLKYTASDGTEVDLSKLRGKVVLVDFWATWCPPCRAEVPKIVDAFHKYHDKGFEIVGVSLDQEEGALSGFTKRNGMTWPQFFDGQMWDNKISSSLGIHFVPQMWLLDKKGMLVTATDSIDKITPQIEHQLATP